MSIEGEAIPVWITAKAAEDDEVLERCELVLVLHRGPDIVGIRRKPFLFDRFEAMIDFWESRIKPLCMPVVGILYRDSAEEEIAPFCMSDEEYYSVQGEVTVPSS